MTISEFEYIIAQGEGLFVDFKETYNFIAPSQNNPKTLTRNDIKTSKESFVKDVVSFANTIRYEPAYIIIGIADNGERVGINTNININKFRDDSKFQTIVKDAKVSPHPQFKYSELEYKEKIFGIIEFSLPINDRIIPHDGKYYIRKGSTNAELKSEIVEPSENEVNDVKNWLKRLAEANWDKLIKTANSNHLIIDGLNKKDIVKVREELNKQDARNAFLRAQLYEIEEKKAEAHGEYLKAIKLDPDNQAVLNELSMSYFELDDLPNTLHYFGKLLNSYKYNLTDIYKALIEYISEEGINKNTLRVAKYKADIGVVLMFKGKTDKETEEAKEMLASAYSVFKEYYGENHIKTANVQIALSVIGQPQVLIMLRSIPIEEAMKMLYKF